MGNNPPCPPELEEPIMDALALLRAALAGDQAATAIVAANLANSPLSAVTVAAWLASLMQEHGYGEETVRRLAELGGLPQG